MYWKGCTENEEMAGADGALAANDANGAVPKVGAFEITGAVAMVVVDPKNPVVGAPNVGAVVVEVAVVVGGLAPKENIYQPFETP